MIAQAEIRSKGWTYRAEMYDKLVGSHGGASGLTGYYRYDGSWKPVSWSSIPGSDYSRLRRGLQENLAWQAKDDPSLRRYLAPKHMRTR